MSIQVQRLARLITFYKDVLAQTGDDSSCPVQALEEIRRVVEEYQSETVIHQVECQLDRWQLVGARVGLDDRNRILRQARSFAPLSATDEPLVTGGFDYGINNPWEAINRLSRYGVALNLIAKDAVRYAEGMEPAVGFRLVHFDVNNAHGLSSESALKEVRRAVSGQLSIQGVNAQRAGIRLAGIEVFERLMLDPEIVDFWGQDLNLIPHISGLQVKYGDRKFEHDWSGVMQLQYDERVDKVLARPSFANSARFNTVSPVVIECTERC